MATTVRVVLTGGASTTDARGSLKVLDEFFDVMRRADEANRSEERERLEWSIVDLGTGSVVLEVAPNRNADLVLRSVIDGFAWAEEHEGLPDEWEAELSTSAMKLAKSLGQSLEELEIQWQEGRRVRGHVRVTGQSAKHLATVLGTQRVSVGSIIGRLDSASTHGKLSATLWPDAGGKSVSVHFADQQKERVRHAWGHRVEVSGVVTSDWRDMPVTMVMSELDLMPDDPPPLEYFHGRYPDFTDGRDAVEYVRWQYEAS